MQGAHISKHVKADYSDKIQWLSFGIVSVHEHHFIVYFRSMYIWHRQCNMNVRMCSTCLLM